MSAKSVNAVFTQRRELFVVDKLTGIPEPIESIGNIKRII